MQPYLYVTTSMIWWAWTACASEWIEDDNSNVIQAMCKIANVNWRPAETAYEHMERDTEDKIPWRLHPNNRGFDAGKMPKDDKLVDLQYLTLEGTEQQLCRRIAAVTMPQMSPNDVKSVLHRLEDHLLRLPRGGYAYQPRQTFFHWHRYITLPRQTPEGEVPGTKQLALLATECPTEYNPFGTNPETEYRTEDDVPKLGGENVKLPVVDLSDMKKKVLYFMPSAASTFRQDVISQALQAAMMCSSFPVGKRLEGFTDPTDPSRFNVATFSPYLIDKCVSELDLNEGFSMNADGEMVYEDPDMPDHMKPTSRREGIVFNHRAGLAKEELGMATSFSMAPTAVGDNSWKERYQSDAQLMSKTQTLVRDLDNESAERRHVEIGRPLDEPVLTPTYIRERHFNESKRLGITPCLNMDWPFELNEVRDALSHAFRAGNGTQDVRKIIGSTYGLSKSESGLTRAQRDMLNAQRQPTLQQQPRRVYEDPLLKRRKI